MRAGLLAALTLLAFVLYVPTAIAQTTSPCPYAWAHNLKVGGTGADVLKLQQFLNASTDTMVAQSGLDSTGSPRAGSPGNETMRFGKLTAAAVSKFQEKYPSDILSPAGLTKGSGVVGALTRAKLNALCMAPTTTAGSATPPPSVNVASAGAAASAATPAEADVLTISDLGQPASSIAPAGAGVNFTTVTLTAGSKDVQLQSMTLERVGMGADAAFFSVALTDPDFLQIGNQYAFNADHKVVFHGPYTIPAHMSVTLTIVGYMASDLTNFDGQTPALQIDGITASSPVVGSFPLKGSPQTLNTTLVIGGATAILSPLDPNQATTHYINDTGVRFSAIRMTANSQEDVSLSYMIWYQSGTAGTHDLANVVTVVGTTSYPAIPSADGKTYISLMNPAVVIPKGRSVDISIQGDLLVSGANRTVEFDLSDNTDDEGTGGVLYGFGVAVVPGANTATTGHSVFITSDGTTAGTSGYPFFAGSITTISGGAVITIGR